MVANNLISITLAKSISKLHEEFKMNFSCKLLIFLSYVYHVRDTCCQFAPERESNTVKWLIDGQDYMSAVADALKAAKYEILITDWQMNPHVHLKRPDDGVKSLEWRLDMMLLYKAKKGIKIYILLYWENNFWPVSMDLGSKYTKLTLENENITILRHPAWFNFLNLRFSHHEKLIVVDRTVAFVGGIDLSFGRWDTHNHPLTDNYPCHFQAIEIESHNQTEQQFCRWVGMDYSNTFQVGDRTGYNEPLKEICRNHQPIRYTTPRLPWHDVACLFSGKSVLDVVEHFIQRFNAISKDETLSNDPKCLEDPLGVPSPNTAATIQVVRSVTGWSANQPLEDSIHQAYLYAIEHSQHSIYIENQFFVSMDDTKVMNKIKTALYERILRAFKNSQMYHVIIILPLKPEFKEEWCTSFGSPLESITCYNYETLFRGDQSLYVMLEKEGVPVDDYLSVYGLRTHDILDGKPVTEIIYVHSKLMIVDDRITIIGSANINDRSMLGHRDSEVDVVIKDTEMILGKMDGENYDVGKFSHSLRCQLMREHLGVLKGHNFIEVSDPIAQHFLSRISSISRENTNIYERVFNGSLSIFPTDQVKDEEDFKKWKTWSGLASTSFSEAAHELENINGHLVSFPRSFMENECKKWKVYSKLVDPCLKCGYGPEFVNKCSIEGRYLVTHIMPSGQFYC